MSRRMIVMVVVAMDASSASDGGSFGTLVSVAGLACLDGRYQNVATIDTLSGGN